MQKLATKVFIYASLVFGLLGIAIVLTMPPDNRPNADINSILNRLLMVTVFIILTSFALSVAGKYLKNGKK